MGTKPNHELKENAVPTIFHHLERKRPRPTSFQRQESRAKKQVTNRRNIFFVYKKKNNIKIK